MMRSIAWAPRLAARAALALLGCACGDATPASPEGATTGGEQPATCNAGSVVGPDGACMPVGIQGCAPMFMGDDNLCHPSMTRCPAGQIPSYDEGCTPVGIQGCAPEFLDDGALCRPSMSKCPQGTFAVPQEGCLPVDGPEGCGTGAWGNLDDAPGTVFVDPSYAGPGSDGTRAAPFTTLSDALARVARGGRIALAEGVYPEPIVITRAVEIAGRCASRVRLQGASADALPVAVAVDTAEDVTLRGVEIRAQAVGVAARNASALRLERVVIRDASSVGVLAVGGSRVSISRSWIDGTRRGDAGSAAVFASEGSSVTLEASALTGNELSALNGLRRNTEFHLNGCLIEGTTPSGRALSTAALVSTGAVLTLENSAFVGNAGFGILAQGRGSSAVATGSLIEATQVAVNDVGDSGIGAGASFGGQLSLVSSIVSGNATSGLLAIHQNTRAQVTRSLLQRNGIEFLAGKGSGIAAAEGAVVSLDRSALWQNYGSGVAVITSAEVDSTGSLVEDTLASTDGLGGFGFSIVEGRVGLRSDALVGNRSVSLIAREPGELTVTESIVEGTLPEEKSLRFGTGAQMSNGVQATLVSSVFSDNLEAGIYFFEGIAGTTDLTVTGSLIRGTLSQQSDDAYGVGLFAEACGISVRSSVVRDSQTAGVMLAGGARGDVLQTAIDGVVGGNFTLEDGSSAAVGDGVLARLGSEINLSDVTSRGCARAGILYHESAGSIERTSATNNRFGIVHQGSPQPIVGGGVALSGNTERDKVIGGILPIPEGPPAVP